MFQKFMILLRNMRMVMCEEFLVTRTVALLEFFLNRAELSLSSANSGNLKIPEAWFGLNLKVLSLHVFAGAVVASWSLTQVVAGSSSFTVMTNIFVTEFSSVNSVKHLGKTPLIGSWLVSSFDFASLFGVAHTLYKRGEKRSQC